MLLRLWNYFAFAPHVSGFEMPSSEPSHAERPHPLTLRPQPPHSS